MGPDPLRLRPDQAADLPEHSLLAIEAFRTTLALAARLRAAMDKRLRDDGLTTQQAALITVVEAAGSPSLSDAATALSCSRQNLKQIASALQRKGLVELRADPDDARTTRIVTTRKSRAYWASRDTSDVDAVAGWFRALDAPALRTLVTTLNLVIAQVDPRSDRPA
ncbi:DNA-binding MarR family transcriptional regulator [Kribbella pratensis]|jgi:DNA-binding MarR family transcriptional regulator|uniref:DNA-binding MarR family transcriptional regulator n=2 Tax=Kribbellaceae TaxID=2726069 RepID=A0ABY2F7F6_9ACTN|nr:DNA-binding MarR family transcriptional regulator [Kribbella sp. VKM Ac-2566]TDW84303.1 DNA-binding MarR family transcriptional regulator [Kribbella pratensis]